MVNRAVEINPPTLNGRLADIHITSHGSDWYWTVFSLFALTFLLFLGSGFTRPATDRVFHYITTTIVAVAALAYFTMASDLGFVPILVEFHRGGKVRGEYRQIFYVRYIDWFITMPLLLLDLLLLSGLPWSHILFTLFINVAMVVSLLVGALVSSDYKWGYWTFAVFFYLYIAYTLVVPVRRHAIALGGDVSRAYSLPALYLLVLWLLYPVAWGVSEGGNVIAPDSEAVFYGVLDIFSKIGFGVLFLWGIRAIEPARLGLRTRAYDEPIPGAPRVRSEKNGGGILNVGANV